MKIYDCFTYFNESEILELRLAHLYDTVDFFVIVEADMTHRGEKKEYNFEKIKDKVSLYQDKIIYVKLKLKKDGLEKNEWLLENAQRNGILDGLKNCSEDDLILISDLDEIPSKNAINSLLHGRAVIDFFSDRKRRLYKKILSILFFPEQLKTKQFGVDLLDRTALVFNQNTYRYFLNIKCGELWQGTIITKFKYLTLPQLLRDRRQKLPRILNGGAHFSYMGGSERILKKCSSIVKEHQDNFSKEYIENCLRNKKDIYNRVGQEYEYKVITHGSSEFSEIDDVIKKYPYLCYISDNDI